MVTDFETKLASFVAGLTPILCPAAEANPRLIRTVEVERGKKNIRIVRQCKVADTGDTVERSAYAFIDIATGGVYKPDGWKRPAKHARGNIFDENNGLGCCGRFGVAYLRG